MRTLRLKFPPTPAHAIDFARDIVAKARELDDLELDFTPESLADVDALIEAWREEGLTWEDMAETLLSVGCYVGEVLRLELGGAWVVRESAPAPLCDSELPMFLEVQGSWWNPIGKTFKRMESGPEDSVAWFFEVAARRVQPDRA